MFSTQILLAAAEVNRFVWVKWTGPAVCAVWDGHSRSRSRRVDDFFLSIRPYIHNYPPARAQSKSRSALLCSTCFSIFVTTDRTMHLHLSCNAPQSISTPTRDPLHIDEMARVIWNKRLQGCSITAYRGAEKKIVTFPEVENRSYAPYWLSYPSIRTNLSHIKLQRTRLRMKPLGVNSNCFVYCRLKNDRPEKNVKKAVTRGVRPSQYWTFDRTTSLGPTLLSDNRYLCLHVWASQLSVSTTVESECYRLIEYGAWDKLHWITFRLLIYFVELCLSAGSLHHFLLITLRPHLNIFAVYFAFHSAGHWILTAGRQPPVACTQTTTGYIARLRFHYFHYDPSKGSVLNTRTRTCLKAPLIHIDVTSAGSKIFGGFLFQSAFPAHSVIWEREWKSWIRYGFFHT
jgi:hypothetical protein